MDTGSDLVWLQCAPCTQCFPQPDPFYSSATSSNYKTITCTNSLCTTHLPLQFNGSSSSTKTCMYTQVYGGQSSTTGDLAYESISLTGLNGTSEAFSKFVFGCGHNNQGFPDVDGLVGLGQGSLSLVNQLKKQVSNLFSYCLVDFYASINKTSLLLLGSAGDTALQHTPIVVAGVNHVNNSFYYVNLLGITVNGA